ncbi:hypothetical protein GCK72_024272 [Caenorhabditis remanei]|uniref:C2H2-type domain-containing protein n=1 Tax=Caenorhabditis remanei TaxID=31234 RepID=A0A6A5FYT5_CAERE|nr:hypothetical protein GCK72_024272 [Caenorhabditis remanei]KAF1747806.1 hypothetical protein GCK72_024272 [Caenorhabditis remanei]
MPPKKRKFEEVERGEPIGSEGEYKCTLCGQEFIRGCGLASHLRKHAPVSFDCYHCGHSSKSKHKHDRHVLVAHADYVRRGGILRGPIIRKVKEELPSDSSDDDDIPLPSIPPVTRRMSGLKRVEEVVLSRDIKMEEPDDYEDIPNSSVRGPPEAPPDPLALPTPIATPAPKAPTMPQETAVPVALPAPVSRPVRKSMRAAVSEAVPVTVPSVVPVTASEAPTMPQETAVPVALPAPVWGPVRRAVRRSEVSVAVPDPVPSLVSVTAPEAPIMPQEPAVPLPAPVSRPVRKSMRTAVSVVVPDTVDTSKLSMNVKEDMPVEVKMEIVEKIVHASTVSPQATHVVKTMKLGLKPRKLSLKKAAVKKAENLLNNDTVPRQRDVSPATRLKLPFGCPICPSRFNVHPRACFHVLSHRQKRHLAPTSIKFFSKKLGTSQEGYKMKSVPFMRWRLRFDNRSVDEKRAERLRYMKENFGHSISSPRSAAADCKPGCSSSPMRSKLKPKLKAIAKRRKALKMSNTRNLFMKCGTQFGQRVIFETYSYYLCKDCPYVTWNVSSLWRHFRHHIQRSIMSWTCVSCSFSSANRVKVDQHVKLHKEIPETDLEYSHWLRFERRVNRTDLNKPTPSKKLPTRQYNYPAANRTLRSADRSSNQDMLNGTMEDQLDDNVPQTSNGEVATTPKIAYNTNLKANGGAKNDFEMLPQPVRAAHQVVTRRRLSAKTTQQLIEEIQQSDEEPELQVNGLQQPTTVIEHPTKTVQQAVKPAGQTTEEAQPVKIPAEQPAKSTEQPVKSTTTSTKTGGKMMQAKTDPKNSKSAAQSATVATQKTVKPPEKAVRHLEQLAAQPEVQQQAEEVQKSAKTSQPRKKGVKPLKSTEQSVKTDQKPARQVQQPAKSASKSENGSQQPAKPAEQKSVLKKEAPKLAQVDNLEKAAEVNSQQAASSNSTQKSKRASQSVRFQESPSSTSPADVKGFKPEEYLSQIKTVPSTVVQSVAVSQPKSIVKSQAQPLEKPNISFTARREPIFKFTPLNSSASCAGTWSSTAFSSATSTVRFNFDYKAPRDDPTVITAPTSSLEAITMMNLQKIVTPKESKDSNSMPRREGSRKRSIDDDDDSSDRSTPSSHGDSIQSTSLSQQTSQSTSPPSSPVDIPHYRKELVKPRYEDFLYVKPVYPDFQKERHPLDANGRYQVAMREYEKALEIRQRQGSLIPVSDDQFKTPLPVTADTFAPHRPREYLMREFAIERSRRCADCPFKEDNLERFRKHRDKHLLPGRHKCKECNYSSFDYHQVQEHMFVDHYLSDIKLLEGLPSSDEDDYSPPPQRKPKAKKKTGGRRKRRRRTDY